MTVSTNDRMDGDELFIPDERHNPEADTCYCPSCFAPVDDEYDGVDEDNLDDEVFAMTNDGQYDDDDWLAPGDLGSDHVLYAMNNDGQYSEDDWLAVETEWSVTPARLRQISEMNPHALIDGLLPSNAVVTFAGEPAIGKSFIALSWAACVAEGLPWFGHAVRGHQRVAYVLGEGWSAFGRRVKAWEDINGRPMGTNLHFVDGAGQGVDLSDGGQVDRALKELHLFRPALVIFDTFAMLANVTSENDNSEVSRVFKLAHQINRELGATVVIVHHVNKDKGQVRGATAFKGNADTVIVAARPEHSTEGAFFISTKGEHDGKQRDMSGITLGGFEIVEPGVLHRSTIEAKKSDTRTAIHDAMTD